MSILKGKDLVVVVDERPVFHVTQHQINLNADFEDWETKSSDGKQKTLTGHSGTVQVDGLIAMEQSETESDIPSLLMKLKTGAPVSLMSDITDDAGSALVSIVVEKAWLTGITMTGQIGQNSTYSAQFSFNDFEV